MLDTSLSLSSTGRNLEGALGIGTFVFSYNTLQSVNCPTTPLATNDLNTDTLKVTVYPNPTNDIVTINYNLEDSSNVVLQLTNIQGQVISQTKLDKSNGLQTDTLNLSNQSSGMYFVSITTEYGSFTTKVIKR